MPNQPPDEPIRLDHDDLYPDEPPEEPIWDDDPEPVEVRPVPPQPGVLVSILLCLLYLVVSQLFLSIVIMIGVGAFMLADHPNPKEMLELLSKPEAQDDPVAKKFMSRLIAWTLVIQKPFEVLFSLLLLRYFVGRFWLQKVAFRWPSFQHFLLCVIGIPAFWICGLGIASLLEIIMPEQAGQFEELIKEMFEELATFPTIVSIVTIAVCPSLAEEFFCRGLLGRGLKARLGLWGGILFTSFLFGAIHIIPAQAIYAACLGVGLHAAYYFTRSLWVPILIHFGNNALSTLMMREQLPFQQALDAEPKFTVWLFVTAISMLLSVSVAIYLSRVRYVSSDPDDPSPTWKPPYPGVMLPPANSDTVPDAPFAGVLSWFMVILTMGAFAIAVAFALQN